MGKAEANRLEIKISEPPIDAPLVSIVIPIYNCEDYLEQCINSLLGQSYRFLELICVDDGSTDNSASILSNLASSDSRIQVLTQQNSGPGRARNMGISKAKGEYLLFFDCDDWCEPSLLKCAVARAQETQADIVALPHFIFDQRVGEVVPASWALMPDKYPTEVCNWKDNPDWIFQAFQNFPWNKLLRTEFIRENNLRFQEDIRLTEDLMFSAPALIRASRLTFLPDMLLYHREGTGTNSMANKDRYPLDFITAFRSLKQFLESEGIYDQLRIAYQNWALSGFIYNLHTLNTYEGFNTVMTALAGKNGALAELDLADISDDDLQETRFAEFLRDTKEKPVNYLYKLYVIARENCDERGNRLVIKNRMNHELQRSVIKAGARITEAERERDELRAQLNELQGVHDHLQKEFNAQMNAVEQKVGQAICWIPRRIQEAVLRLQK